MQLGRVSVSGEVQFAARRKAGDDWTSLSAMGLQARDTSDVIAIWGDVVAGVGSAPDVPATAELGCPAVRPSKVLAIGLNYLSHIRETNSKLPDRPVVFAKYPSALNGPYDPILLDPHLTAEPDYEAELAVIVGRPARRLTRDNALDHVFGYAVANDVSARDWQRIDSQFSRSKSLDTFCPLGPWITTADEVPDPQALEIRSEVNGEERQASSTQLMLFPVADLLVYLSSTMTLEPGDVILTGTPPGVGIGRTPPVFLQPGDLVRCEVHQLGHIANRVVEDPESCPPIVIERGNHE